MAYSMVYWVKAKQWSIVNCDNVVGDKVIRCTTYVIHHNKPYEARILRVSDSYQELSKLTVTEDGFLLDFPLTGALADTSKVEKTKADTKKALLKKNKTKEKKATGHGEILPPVHQTDKRPKSPKDATEVLGDDDKTTQAALPAAAVTAEPPGPESPRDATEVLGNDDKTVQALWPAAAVTAEPPASSEEVVSYLEGFCSWWRRRESGVIGISQNPSTKHTSIPTVAKEMIELLPAYPTVLIERRQRNAITKKYKDSPSAMATHLLRAIHSKEQLKKWSARGHGDQGGVPTDTMAAIEDYVAVYAAKPLSKKGLTKAVNNMLQELPCGTKRGRKKKKIKPKASPRKSFVLTEPNTDECNGDGPAAEDPQIKSPNKEGGKDTPAPCSSDSVMGQQLGTFSDLRATSPWKVLNLPTSRPVLPISSPLLSAAARKGQDNHR